MVKEKDIKDYLKQNDIKKLNLIEFLEWYNEKKRKTKEELLKKREINKRKKNWNLKELMSLVENEMVKHQDCFTDYENEWIWEIILNKLTNKVYENQNKYRMKQLTKSRIKRFIDYLMRQGGFTKPVFYWNRKLKERYFISFMND